MQREATFQPAEDGGQRRVLLARARLRGNRANCAASEEHFPSAAQLRIPAALFLFVFRVSSHPLLGSSDRKICDYANVPVIDPTGTKQSC